MAQALPIDAILDLIRDEAWDAAKSALAASHPADIADIIDRSPSDDIARVFALVPDNLKPDVLAELESVAGSEVLEALSVHEISEIVEDMAPDDAADILAELPSERSEEVLDLMEDEDSEEVRRLLEYEEDTAGGIMTPDVVSMKMDSTVAEALEAIAYFEDGEPFFYAYIVDQANRLIGYAHIWELLREKQRMRPLGELAHTDLVSANVDMDQEEVARLMNQYALSAIPVVDSEGRLVGRVTIDDVVDVMEDEASEDIFRLAGSDDADLETGSPIKSCMVRLPWLIITLLGGFITSLILRHFHAQIADLLVLAAFVPIILAMGGNTGIQSSTLIVRTIAVRGIEGRSLVRILLKEIQTGAIMGIFCGIAIGLWVSFVTARAPHPTGLSPQYLGFVVGLALFSAMTFAAMFGAFVPIMLNRARIDPAVAAGPFITITNDISALLIYFGIILLLIQRFSTLP